MALLGKRKGAFGIAYEDVPGTPEATATYVLPVDSANIEGSPVTYERVNNIGADPIGRKQSGFEYAWNFSGAELSIEEIGYLIWLYLGDEDNTTTPGTHTMPSSTIPYSSKHFTIFKDHGGAFTATNQEVEILAGCRMDTLTIEQPHKGYAKVSASGYGMSITKSTNDLTRSVVYGGMGWHNILNAAGGGVGVGYYESDPTGLAFTRVKSFKIEFKREIDRAGRNYASNNPSAIVEGGRSITTEIVAEARSFDTTLYQVLSTAESAGRLRWYFKWNDATATEYLTIDIPTNQIVNSPKGDIGSGVESQEWTFQSEAYRYADANNLVDVVAKDGNLTSYAARVGV